jgi:Cdc6-like AAA superfamily ATPase
MLSTTDLIKENFLEHPFLRYGDPRFFFPHISEQRNVLEVAWGFINDQNDPKKNLGVIAGPVGSGKSMLAMKIAAGIHPGLKQSVGYGIYMNTNTVTEPRHFLMAVIDALGLPSSRSNANRMESIFKHLNLSPKGLLLVLDGPPVDQEYLHEMLAWSVENMKKIKALVFLQDLNETATNLGGLNEFLGLYHPYRAPSTQEIANLLYSRCKMAGHPNPLTLLDEKQILEIAASAHGSLTNALMLANEYLERIIEEKKNRLTVMDI